MATRADRGCRGLWSSGGHRSTVRALVEAHRELREVDAAVLDAIADSGEPIAADLVRLHRRVVTLLAADWYDTKDLRETATATLTAEPARAGEIGAVVLFLPQDLPPATVSPASAACRGTATCTRSPD